MKKKNEFSRVAQTRGPRNAAHVRARGGPWCGPREAGLQRETARSGGNPACFGDLAKATSNFS